MTDSSCGTPPAQGAGSPAPSRRRVPTWCYTLILLVAAAGTLVAVAAYTGPELVAGPMVQIPAPDELVVVWEMKSPFPMAVVTLTGANGESRTAFVDHVADASHSDFRGLCVPGARRYEVTFPGLRQDGDYAYTIENRGFLGWRHSVAGPFTVRTRPPRGRPFRFLAFGDSGVGSHSQYALAEVMAECKPDLVIHAGDLDQSNGDPSNYFTSFFEPYAALIRSIPFMPVLGNHDCVTDFGQPLLDIFVLPDNGPGAIPGERNYWFDFGDARFVGLDSNRIQERHGGAISETQMQASVAPWLREALTHCDAQWKIVYYHHPFYTGSAHGPEGAAYVKEAYVRVFEECGVDMVFNGHNHLYERSRPIRQDQVVREGEGVVYITTGTGGARRYPMNLPPPHYNQTYNDQVLGFSCVDLTANRLELKQISITGRVLDSYTIEKPAAGAPSQGGSVSKGNDPSVADAAP